MLDLENNNNFQRISKWGSVCFQKLFSIIVLSEYQNGVLCVFKNSFQKYEPNMPISSHFISFFFSLKRSISSHLFSFSFLASTSLFYNFSFSIKWFLHKNMDFYFVFFFSYFCCRLV